MGHLRSYRDQAWRDAFRSIVTERDVEDVFHSVLTEAKAGDMQAANLFIKYVLGDAPKGTPGITLDEGADLSLATPEKCIEAAEKLLEAQLRGLVDEQQAAALRATIDQALKASVVAAGSGHPENPLGVVVNVQSYEAPKRQIESEGTRGTQ